MTDDGRDDPTAETGERDDWPYGGGDQVVPDGRTKNTRDEIPLCAPPPARKRQQQQQLAVAAAVVATLALRSAAGPR